MARIWICDDPGQCKLLWWEALRDDGIFHRWETRDCFQEAFQRTPCFIVCEGAEGLLGLLPLSRIEETGTLAFFPGETWHGKTWLEGNRIVARSAEVFQALLEAVPGDAHLRYLDNECLPSSFAGAAVDEVGYLFQPRQHDGSFPSYLSSIPRKTLKRLQREPDALRERGVTFRYDAHGDIEELFRMNLAAFGADSYFHDERFLGGFERLIAALDRHGALRVTTVLVAGTIAAVDVGAVCDNAYTLLAGGTNCEFPGVAKLINFHHLEVACRQRYDSVDFLCGDFGWKQRFRLTSRPLYQIVLAGGDVREESEMACATGTPVHA